MFHQVYLILFIKGYNRPVSGSLIRNDKHSYNPNSNNSNHNNINNSKERPISGIENKSNNYGINNENISKPNSNNYNIKNNSNNNSAKEDSSKNSSQVNSNQGSGRLKTDSKVNSKPLGLINILGNKKEPVNILRHNPYTPNNNLNTNTNHNLIEQNKKNDELIKRYACVDYKYLLLLIKY